MFLLPHPRSRLMGGCGGASAIHMLLWLEPPFICWGKRWKHLRHKLAIWRLENSIPSSWFKHLGKAKLEHKDLEAFCPLMFITSRGLFRLCVALGAVQLENASMSVFVCLVTLIFTFGLMYSLILILLLKGLFYSQLTFFAQICSNGLIWYNKVE